jgi:RNA polymerase sigma-70 factor, ECF subfamily
LTRILANIAAVPDRRVVAAAARAGSRGALPREPVQALALPTLRITRRFERLSAHAGSLEASTSPTRAMLVKVTSPDSLATSAWSAGRRRWPQIELELAAFERWIAELPSEAVEKYADDLFLASACGHGDAAALRVFEEQLLAPAQAAIDASETFVDEATQRVRTHLLVADPTGQPKIASYAGRGPLRAWVSVSAARVALMMVRSTRRAKEVAEPDWTDVMSATPTDNPELDLLKRQHAAAFGVALSEAALELEPRLRSVLRMHFIDDLSIDEIGAIYAVHRATAARWIQRAREVLFHATRARLAARLQLSSAELDRITALVQSQLDVSLSQLLPASMLETAAPGRTR